MIEVKHPTSQMFGVSLRRGIDSPYHLPLLKDEIVEARVLESYSLERALLLLKGGRVTARTHVPLKKGGVLSLKVHEVFPTPILKLIATRYVAPDEMNSSIILAALKENPWRAVLENIHQCGLPKESVGLLRELVTSLSLRSFITSAPELLRVLIDRSGLRWEAKLRGLLFKRGIRRDNLNNLIAGDLKGLSSRFLALVEDNGALRRLISTIQNIQLLNSSGLEHKRKLFFPIPIQFPDGIFTVGQLLIQLPYGEREEQMGTRGDGLGVFRVTFLLELSSLGPLRADLTIKGRNITGRILVTKEEARSRIEEGIPIYVGSMKEKGFSVHSMECHIMKYESVTQPLLPDIIEHEGTIISLIA